MKARALAVLLTSLVITSALSVLFAIRATNSSAQSGKPLLIGAAVGRTGFMSAFDGPALKAAEIAVEDINAAGGVLGRPLKIIYGDTKSDQTLAGPVALELIAKGAEFIIPSGDFDYGSPAAFAAQDKGIAAMTPMAGSPKFGPQGIGPLAFTLATGGPGQAAMLAEWAYSKRGYRRAYALEDASIQFNKSVCESFRQRWTQLAGAKGLVGRDTFLQNDASIASQVTRLRATRPQPQFVFICSSPPGGVSAIRQIRAGGINAPIIGTEAFDGDYWLRAVPRLSNFYHSAFGSVFGDDPRPKVKAFFVKYKQRTGKPPVSSYVLTGYSVIEAFARAAKMAGSTDGKKLAAAFNTFRNVPLLVGPTTFTATTHINPHRPMAILEVQNGRHRFVTLARAKKVPKVGL